VLANPSPAYGGPYSLGLGLLAEAVIIAVVFGIKGFDPVRCFYGWTGGDSHDLSNAVWGILRC
jgi:hypothetical protein